MDGDIELGEHITCRSIWMVIYLLHEKKGTKRKRLVISKAKTRTIGDIIKDDHK